MFAEGVHKQLRGLMKKLLIAELGSDDLHDIQSNLEWLTRSDDFSRRIEAKKRLKSLLRSTDFSISKTAEDILCNSLDNRQVFFSLYQHL